MTTLYDGTSTVTLPRSLEWVDEYQYSSVKQDKQATIGGGIIVSESITTAGRPITLVGGEFVWVDKTVIDDLVNLLNVAGKIYTLTLADARVFNVMFDRSSTPLEAKPVLRKNVQDGTAKYTLTLRFMEV